MLGLSHIVVVAVAIAAAAAAAPNSIPKCPLLSPHSVILFCSTGGAGTIAAGRRGRAHPPLNLNPTSSLLKNKVNHKTCSGLFQKRASERVQGFVCVGGCVGLQYSDSAWMSEMLVVVHLMYILVWILSGRGVYIPNPEESSVSGSLCLLLGKSAHILLLHPTPSCVEIKPCLWFRFAFVSFHFTS